LRAVFFYKIIDTRPYTDLIHSKFIFSSLQLYELEVQYRDQRMYIAGDVCGLAYILGAGGDSLPTTSTAAKKARPIKPSPTAGKVTKRAKGIGAAKTKATKGKLAKDVKKTAARKKPVAKKATKEKAKPKKERRTALKAAVAKKTKTPRGEKKAKTAKRKQKRKTPLKKKVVFMVSSFYTLC